MNRRDLIKTAIVATGGLLLLPSCWQSPPKSLTRLKNITISDDDEKLLTDVVDAIIPPTNTPGAVALNVNRFILKMIDDCYVPHDQQRYIKGLKSINAYCKNLNGKDFSDTDSSAKLKIFKQIAGNTDKENDLHFFLQTTRYLTILGYTRSEYVMTKLVPYQLVPGHFYGCVKV